MSLSLKIREQLISSFGAELAEHVQTMTDGLLALEQQQVVGEQRQFTLETVFRAAHSLKGAARALGISAVEQLAHSLENILDAIQRDVLPLTPDLFTTCYRALDTIQLVQAVYDSGGTTPPVQVLQTLAELEEFKRLAAGEGGNGSNPEAIPNLKSMVAQAARQVGAPSQPMAAPSQAMAAPAAMPAAMPAAAPLPPAPKSAAPRATVRPTPPPAAVMPAAVMPAAVMPAAMPAAMPAVIPAATLRKPEGREAANVVTIDTTPAAVLHPDGPAAADATDETIRVNVAKLDAVMEQLSELLVTKIRAEQRLGQMRQTQKTMLEWQKEWLFIRRVYGRVMRKLKDFRVSGETRKDLTHLLAYVSASQEYFRRMQAAFNALSREYANDTMHSSLVMDELEQEIKHVRMLPLATISVSFARMVRDLAKAANKEVAFQIVGGDVELDKRVLEQIKDPLIHLLRNAIDHGIEAPERRAELGKPHGGTVTLTAEPMGNDVIIRVSDDGGGLDIPAIRRVAAHRANIPDAWTLSESELVELIFNPRFSTSPIITDVSGRGIGLDVVRRNIASLGGRIDVDWTPDHGSTFALTVPLTLISSRGLLVRVSEALFAIPFNAIERILRVENDKLVSLGGYKAVRYQGRAFPLVRLGDVLEVPPSIRRRDAEGVGAPVAESAACVLVVIVAAAERRVAFTVDELVGEQEMVVKGLGKQLVRVGGIAGAALLGSGEVLLVLNVADLIKLTLRMRRRIGQSVDAAAEVNLAPTAVGERAEATSGGGQLPEHHILVVDDSVTTRTLEKNVLEAAGYSVQLAINGEEAWTLLTTGPLPDLVLSDVMMPRLDGFGLTERLKSDPRTARVPVILVTSLDSPEDKTRGIEVGADAYIIKSRFDQNNLLETIAQLI